jgi:hypothetical protein
MRENPIRALEDFRAKSVGGRSIRKRLARSSSIASAPIIASITVAKAAIDSRERQSSRILNASVHRRVRSTGYNNQCSKKQWQIANGIVYRSDFSGKYYKAGRFIQFCARSGR